MLIDPKLAFYFDAQRSENDKKRRHRRDNVSSRSGVGGSVRGHGTGQDGNAAALGFLPERWESMLIGQENDIYVCVFVYLYIYIGIYIYIYIYTCIWIICELRS